MKGFYSHGKLLLTGEYVVLDGAKALAVPTLYGQSLDVEKGSDGKLEWLSLDENDEVWFKGEYQFSEHMIESVIQNNNSISERLLQILRAAKQLNSEFLTDAKGYQITTTLGFPKNWGLGTSSTLINNIASWAKVNPYQLLELTFGGSGYDIACARARGSLTYQLDQNMEPLIEEVTFNPSFMKDLYFVHLNQKQNSREGIATYRTNTSNVSTSISKINAITDKMITCNNLEHFQALMEAHETLISAIIKQVSVQHRLFKDFNGSIKSLGAWGGDFVMVASKSNPTSYFNDKGYRTILRYSDMVKN